VTATVPLASFAPLPVARWSLAERRGTVAVWIIRGGRSGEFIDLALERDLSIVGWGEQVPHDLSRLSQPEIRELLNAAFPDAPAGRNSTNAGQLYRFASVVQPGDLVVMPRGPVPNAPDAESESLVALGRVEGQYEYRTDLQGVRHVRAVTWLEREVPVQLLSEQLRTAMGGAVATLTMVKSPDVERELQVLLGLRREVAPVHVVLRWTREAQVDTIQQHKDIAESRGAVWWGKVGDPAGRRALSDNNLAILRAQLDEGVLTFVYLYGMGTAWRTRLSAVTLEEADVEPDLVPTYYGDAPHNLWVRLSEFEPLEPEQLLDGLSLRSDPTRRLRTALGGQASVLLVQKAAVAPPQRDRYFILSQSAGGDDETLDEEGARYFFEASVAGQRRLREAHGGRFIYY
jgi:hypothetical protein